MSVIDEMHVRVIHKVINEGVKEEVKCYKSSDITVLDYNNSKCMGKEAVERARMRMEQEYNNNWNNCEDYVYKVRTDVEDIPEFSKAIKDVAIIAVERKEEIAGGLIGAGVGTIVLPGIGTIIGGGVGLMVGWVAKIRNRRI